MSNNPGHKLGLLNLLVLILSLYVLGALLADSFLKLSSETTRMLAFTDNLICGVFFIDFCVEFYLAENKLKFMRWGWIDLISCVPNVNYLRPGRIARRSEEHTSELQSHSFISYA